MRYSLSVASRRTALPGRRDGLERPSYLSCLTYLPFIPIAALFLVGAAAGLLRCPAQQPAPDAADQEAARLEIDLVRYKDTTPEAAEILVRLVDLYHANGRVFGLVRTAQKFITVHPADKRHKAVMLKLLDALESLSRNQELIAACRQFLERYPNEPESAAIEVRLARTLERTPERLRTADGLAHRLAAAAGHARRPPSRGPRHGALRSRCGPPRPCSWLPTWPATCSTNCRPARWWAKSATGRSACCALPISRPRRMRWRSRCWPRAASPTSGCSATCTSGCPATTRLSASSPTPSRASARRRRSKRRPNRRAR